METLAGGVVRAGVVGKVKQVVDRFLNFLSLSPTEFSLGIPKVFSLLHSVGISDVEIDALIESTVDGLFSVIATLRVVPLILCPLNPASPANMTGKRLELRIRNFLSQQGAAASHMFGPAFSGAFRPSLIILDREIDMNVMIHHTWTYQALVHDVLGFTSNRTSVPVPPEADRSLWTKMKTYDLDSSDPFWCQHAGSSFAEAAVGVSEALAEYNRKIADIHQSHNISTADGDITSSLATAINALPEMTDLKRSIDMHTNIATALVNEIKSRGIDKFYEIEDEFERGSLTNAVSQMEQLLKPSAKGTLEDKARALVCLYLAKPSIPIDRLRVLMNTLEALGGSRAPMEYLLHLESFKSMHRDLTVSSLGTSFGATTGSSLATEAAAAIGGFGSKVLDRGMGLLQGVRSILPLTKNLPISNLCEALLDRKQNTLADTFTCLDPKSPAGVEVPRLRTPLKHGVIFVVGGGNYVEAHAIKELAAKKQKHLLYGSTHFASPSEFLAELSSISWAKP